MLFGSYYLVFRQIFRGFSVNSFLYDFITNLIWKRKLASMVYPEYMWATRFMSSRDNLENKCVLFFALRARSHKIIDYFRVHKIYQTLICAPPPEKSCILDIFYVHWMLRYRVTSCTWPSVSGTLKNVGGKNTTWSGCLSMYPNS